MDDMKAMMQDALRQALAGLMPPPAPATTANLSTTAATALVSANPPAVNASPADNDNTRG